MPRLRDSSGGMKRRPMFCKFVVNFEGREDVTLKDRIIANELPGIFNFFYKGYKDILSQGFITPCIDQQEILNDFEITANPVLAFWQDYRDEVIGDGIYHEVKTKDLFIHYQKWCESNNYKPCSSQVFQDTFFKTLQRLQGITITKSRIRDIDGKQPYIYKIGCVKAATESELDGVSESVTQEQEILLTEKNIHNMSKRDIQKMFARKIPDLNKEQIMLELTKANIRNVARYKCISACELDCNNRTYDEQGEISGQVINGVYQAI